MNVNTQPLERLLKQKRTEGISMMLHSNPNGAKQARKNHGASLTIRAAGPQETKAFLREECRERQRFWRSRPW